MSIKLENTLNNICHGCLSSDRLLCPLSKNTTYFFSQLLSMEILQDNNYELFKIMLCWECRALTHKMQAFQLRIQQAYDTLLQASELVHSQPFQTLSNLSTTTQIGYLDIKTKSEVNQYDSDDFIKTNLDDASNHPIVKEDDTKTKTVDETNDDDDYYDDDMKTEYLEENNVNEQEQVVDDKAIIEMKQEILNDEVKENLSKDENKRKGKKLKRRLPKVIAHKNHYTKVKLTETEVEELRRKRRFPKHYTEKDYKCDECVDAFDTELQLDNHNLEIHKRKKGPHECNICQTKFASKDKMQSHHKTHFIALKCNYCDYKTYVHQLQREHYRRFHYQYSLKCDKCDQSFQKLADYQKHTRTAHRENVYVCDYCGSQKSSKRVLINHLTRYHSDFKCRYCGEQKSTYIRLYRHYILKHGVYSYKSEGNKKCECYCVECDKQYPSLERYRAHLRSSVRHTPRKKKTVPCPDCGKIFTKTCYMNNHYNLVHLKKTKHYCDICDKYFANGFGLRQHKEFVHQGKTMPRDKICEECGMAFTTRPTLKRHMMTHTGERPFQCPHCPSRFSQKSAMSTHIKNIHNKQRPGYEK